MKIKTQAYCVRAFFQFLCKYHISYLQFTVKKKKNTQKIGKYIYMYANGGGERNSVDVDGHLAKMHPFWLQIYIFNRSILNYSNSVYAFLCILPHLQKPSDNIFQYIYNIHKKNYIKSYYTIYIYNLWWCTKLHLNIWIPLRFFCWLVWVWIKWVWMHARVTQRSISRSQRLWMNSTFQMFMPNFLL